MRPQHDIRPTPSHRQEEQRDSSSDVGPEVDLQVLQTSGDDNEGVSRLRTFQQAQQYHGDKKLPGVQKQRR